MLCYQCVVFIFKTIALLYQNIYEINPLGTTNHLGPTSLQLKFAPNQTLHQVSTLSALWGSLIFEWLFWVSPG